MHFYVFKPTRLRFETQAVFLARSGPRWASWNLGVFICIRCAGIHRNLGVHISRVKSVNLDQWTSEQIQVLFSYLTTLVQLKKEHVSYPVHSFRASIREYQLYSQLYEDLIISREIEVLSTTE